MKRIESINLAQLAFNIHRTETTSTHWKMLHAHAGLEFLYIYEGQGEITVERQTYSLLPNTFVCFQPFQLHRVEVPPQASGAYIRINLTFDPLLLEPYLTLFPQLNAFFRQVCKGELPRQVFHLAPNNRLALWLEEYYTVQLNEAGHNHEEQILFLIRLFQHLQQDVFPKTAAASASQRISLHIERMTEWMERNYHRPFQLEQMASELHVTTHHLSHLFKQYTGSTMTEYLTARRIREACSLLACTDKPIAEIANAVGGFGPSYFCQLFKSRKGMTPQAYRATIRHTPAINLSIP
ncbi:AraC family transcriptional regulator [Paenibacillaceae bacterium]|nr:AraC family transcriptional regulator [Paenibacillaceae bacterium]